MNKEELLFHFIGIYFFVTAGILYVHFKMKKFFEYPKFDSYLKNLDEILDQIHLHSKNILDSNKSYIKYSEKSFEDIHIKSNEIVSILGKISIVLKNIDSELEDKDNHIRTLEGRLKRKNKRINKLEGINYDD